MKSMEPHDTVVKADLVDRVYKKVGFTRQEALEAVEILFKEIKMVYRFFNELFIFSNKVYECFRNFHIINWIHICCSCVFTENIIR